MSQKDFEVREDFLLEKASEFVELCRYIGNLERVAHVKYPTEFFSILREESYYRLRELLVWAQVSSLCKLRLIEYHFWMVGEQGNTALTLWPTILGIDLSIGNLGIFCPKSAAQYERYYVLVELARQIKQKKKERKETEARALMELQARWKTEFEQHYGGSMESGSSWERIKKNSEK